MFRPLVFEWIQFISIVSELELLCYNVLNALFWSPHLWGVSFVGNHFCTQHFSVLGWGSIYSNCKTSNLNDKLKLPTLCWVSCAGILFTAMIWNKHSSQSSQSLFCFSTVIGECHLGGLQFWFGQVEGAFVSFWFGTVKKFIFHSGRTNIAGLGKSGPFWRCIFYWTRGKYWISIASVCSARVALGGIIVMAWAACWNNDHPPKSKVALAVALGKMWRALFNTSRLSLGISWKILHFSREGKRKTEGQNLSWLKQ